MLQKTYSFFNRLLTIVMLLIALYWLLTSTIVLAGATQVMLVIIVIGIALVALLPNLCRWCYRMLMRYKLVLLVLAVIYQLVLVLVTNLMIRSDAAMVFSGATHIVDHSIISLYLSRYPNNLLLFLYERFFYNLFSGNAIWVMQGFNILYANSAGWILYKVAQKQFGQGIADVVFSFYLFFIAFTPQFLTMYTDIMVLPVIALQLYCIFELFYLNQHQVSRKSLLAVLLALITALGVWLRPTLIILPLAVFLVQFFVQNWKQYLQILLVFLAVFAVSYKGLTSVKDTQTEVIIHKEYSITALAYIDLGLTYVGTDQIDFQAGLSQFVTDETRVDENYDGRFSNQVVMKDIKRRLKDYTLSTFIGHILHKQNLTMRDGTLGWGYQDASKEGVYYINPLYAKTVHHPIAQKIRNYLIYTDQPSYRYYRYFIQVIYIILIFGFVYQFLRYSPDSRESMLSLAVFGGLLFLMIFEGGKTRYLIQFLPQIILLSSLGYAKLGNRLVGRRKDG
ncbi:hypothetical protein GGG87_07960 [Streptococcus sp. zg-86]|uniref:Glycosyltransferase RgtA/B/C/D-like domain-containing protein n=1 Tax=Streptococcus zhangguiae TaxID=2664091 RepID=A0A6I4RAX4_9STRE|nr:MULTISPECIES: hypothetical protein [unclassified Streptococcus]MTB64929.1 hypothetical protein [Streptococcus sp. zg-86]MTB91143.1 hypothetical protein [Streptococcus sp. zg-36]MWV56986.1 hypothetical protein [Streptococcus sp. zg-70]QTH47220.1 hypothetical protein J5M87_06575 [Streptococcus sp. zg-86]